MKFAKIVNRIYETSCVILIVIAYKYTLCAVANSISIVVYCIRPINVIHIDRAQKGVVCISLQLAADAVRRNDRTFISLHSVCKHSGGSGAHRESGVRD